MQKTPICTLELSVNAGQKRHELGEAPSTPKADKRATVHIDGELKERFDAYGPGTHKEKINQLLNDADRVKTLEAKVIELERQLKVMSEAAATAQPEPESRLSGTDWSQVPSAELKGSQAPVVLRRKSDALSKLSGLTTKAKS